MKLLYLKVVNLDRRFMNQPIQDSYSGHLEATNCDRWESGVSCAIDEAGCVPDQKQLFRWVDDYKRSICGIELPPSCIEERQEHPDFHLAEMLRGEESDNHHISSMPEQSTFYFMVLTIHEYISSSC